MKTKNRAFGLLLSAVLVATPFAGVSAASASTVNPDQRGPAPTVSSIEAARGSFTVRETTVRSTSVRGFGGGTIYSPTTTTAGRFGAVAIAPGYTARQSSISWLGPRLASQGFVVFTIDTLTTRDSPAQRGAQLLAALDYLTGSSAVRDQIDPARLAVMGHSMGGGGSLQAAKDRPALRAAIPLAGYNVDRTWPEITTPTLVIGAQDDRTAPVRQYSEPFYNSIPATTDKAFIELRGASHFAPNSPNTTIAKYSISWLKRFVDSDTRYTQFLCPAPAVGTAISQSRNNCPF